MKTFVIKEFGDFEISNSSCFDLEKARPHNCVGCFNCWWKTPGKCIYNDLEDFYHFYVNSNKAIFFAKLQCGFVSTKLKTVLDRMIPLFLPYTISAQGGTWHLPRYSKYPNIEFYYDYNFHDEEDKKNFHSYIQKVFEQFHSNEIRILHISQFKEGSL